MARSGYHEEEDSEQGFPQPFPLPALEGPTPRAADILELMLQLVQGSKLLSAFQLRLFALEQRQIERAVAVARACGGSRLGAKLLRGELAQQLVQVVAPI